MAASTSRQPNQTSLSPGPEAHVEQGKKSNSKRRKQKEKPPQVPEKGNLAANSSWEWAPLTDSSACTVPPIFTIDGCYFFSLVGSSVKIYSVSTGEVVSTLSAPPIDGASPALLTSAVINPHNAFQLITSSLDGRLMIWDFLDAVLLHVIDIGQHIHCICAHEKFKDSIFVAASRSNKKKKNFSTGDDAIVLRISLKPTEYVSRSAEIHPIGKIRFPTGLAFSASGAWLIATAAHKVYIAMTSSLTSGFTKYVSPDRLTCLAFHPSEEYFATGDEQGNVRLWYCLNENIAVDVRGVEKKTQTTTLRWHAHAVSSIAFTSNGAYLLSGGEESVLVIWQVDSGKKEFVPRVGAPINTISLSKAGGSEEEYLLGLADATYLFISAGTLKISRTYSRIKIDPAMPYDSLSLSRRMRTPLAVHGLTSNLVLPSSHPSSVQIYSLPSSKLISELEISPSNRVSRRDEKPIVPSYVEQTVLSSSGEWMASIDTRDGDDEFRGEIYLKIWWWDRRAGHWILNTRVDRPHGLKKVTCMAFSPSAKDYHLVTTGEDSSVKTWGLRTVKNKSGLIEEFWVSRSIFGFRSEIPSSASWSPDASLLSISLGPYVVLYDPITNAPHQTLISPGCGAITSAHFVDRGGRCLAVAGKHELVLWDLVIQRVRWHYKASSIIENVIPHPQEDTFAVFCSQSPIEEYQKTQVFVFRATSPIPSSTHSMPFRLRAISQYPLSHKPSAFTFIGITQDWRVVLFGDDIKLTDEEGSTARQIVAGSASTKRTLFQDIFGKSAFTHTLPVPSTSTERPMQFWTAKEGTDAFDTPTHLMPPLESLFEPLMCNFLRPRPQDQHISSSPVTDDEDMDVDADIADPVPPGIQRARVVDQDEMKIFIDLFKKSTATCAPHPISTIRRLSNTLNGEVNPNTHHSALPAVSTSNQNGQSGPAVSNGDVTIVSATPPPSSTAVNGKKRKKKS